MLDVNQGMRLGLGSLRHPHIHARSRVCRPSPRPPSRPRRAVVRSCVQPDLVHAWRTELVLCTQLKPLTHAQQAPLLNVLLLEEPALTEHMLLDWILEPHVVELGHDGRQVFGPTDGQRIL